MANDSLSHQLIVGGADVPAPSGGIEVLYVDAHAALRETTRATMADHRADISVAGVGTVEAALEVAETTPPSCLVVDPVGLHDAQRLLGVVDAPVILYTERESEQLDESLTAVAVTVVEKGPKNRGAFLAEKLIGVVDTPAARSEYALQQALRGVKRRADTGQIAVLVDEAGGIVWSSDPLDSLAGASVDCPADATFYEQLASLCTETPSTTRIDQFRESPEEAVTIRTTHEAGQRHLLLQGYELPATANGLRMILVRDVTEPAGRDARLSLLELLTEQAQDGLYTLDERGVIDFCNDSFATNLGYEPEELRGKHAEVTLAPGELEKGQRTITELLEADEDSTTVDLTFRRKDGTEREISIHYTLLRDKNGDYSGLMGVTRDITDRLERERELERRRELFDGLVDHFPNGAVFLFDDDLEHTMAGGDELDRLNLTAKDFLGQTPSMVFSPENAEQLEAAYRTALNGETSAYHDTFGNRHYEIQTIPIRDSEGIVVSGMALAQNVTDRVRRERELEQSNTVLSTLFDALPVGIVVEDRDRELLTVNQRFVDLFALDSSPDDLVGKQYLDSANEVAGQFVDPAEFVEHTHRLATRRERCLDEHLELADGRIFQRSYLPVDLPMGPSNIWLYRDITERTDRAQELEQTTERLELALDGAKLGVWDWNVESGEITFDERWAEMLGYSLSELDQQLETWEDRIHPDDFDRVWNAIEAHFEDRTEIYQCEYRLQTKYDEYRWIRDIGRVFERDDDGTPIRAVGIHQDITERKERQRELETQRDELATLAQVHVLIQDVIRALGSAATRTEIEETVCDRIVESDLYQFAVLAEREGASTRLTRRTMAGEDDGYLDIVSEQMPAEQQEQDPAQEAIRTGEVQVVHDIATDERMSSWRDAALTRDIRSAVAVPLRHDEAVHGLLIVYANRPEAFSQRAVEAFRVLGEMVGFAFTAVQNRQLLAHDRVVEMQFASEDEGVMLLAVAREHDCEFTDVESVDIGDEALLYLSLTGTSPTDVLDSLCEYECVHDGRVIRTEDDGGVVEVRSDESFQSILLDAGVRPIDLAVDPTRVCITVEAPTDAEPRTIQETLTEHLPGFELAVKQARTREPTVEPETPELRAALTDRQVEVLRAAYLAGYYEWPRDTTAEQLADTLDIASPTLHQHLRRGERNILDGLLDI